MQEKKKNEKKEKKNASHISPWAGPSWNHITFSGRRVWAWLNHSAWQQSALTSVQRDHKTKAIAIADAYRSSKEKTFKGGDGKQEIMTVTGIPQ